MGLALFAPLGKLEPSRLPEIVRKVRQRADAENAEDAPDLVAAMYILMGLRYDEAIIQSIQKEVSEMKESISYQMILKEGKVEGRADGRLQEAQDFLILLGKERLGPPHVAIRHKLRSIDDVDRLHKLGLSTDKVRSWKDLLASK